MQRSAKFILIGTASLVALVAAIVLLASAVVGDREEMISQIGGRPIFHL